MPLAFIYNIQKPLPNKWVNTRALCSTFIRTQSTTNTHNNTHTHKMRARSVWWIWRKINSPQKQCTERVRMHAHRCARNAHDLLLSHASVATEKPKPKIKLVHALRNRAGELHTVRTTRVEMKCINKINGNYLHNRAQCNTESAHHFGPVWRILWVKSQYAQCAEMHGRSVYAEMAQRNIQLDCTRTVPKSKPNWNTICASTDLI